MDVKEWKLERGEEGEGVRGGRGSEIYVLIPIPMFRIRSRLDIDRQQVSSTIRRAFSSEYCCTRYVVVVED